MNLTPFDKFEIVLGIVCIWLVITVPSSKPIVMLVLSGFFIYNLYMLIKSIDRMNNY